VLYDRRDPAETLRVGKNGFPGKFGKETVAGAHRRPKWVPHYGAQADSGSAQALLRLAQDLLRLAQALLWHAHPRLRYAHPQLRLKQQLLTSAD